MMQGVASLRLASVAGGSGQLTLLFRGLRLKCGVEMGNVLAEVGAVSGRMTYRGRVMNRAARIGSIAKTGQVRSAGEGKGGGGVCLHACILACSIISHTISPFKFQRFQPQLYNY